MTFAQVWAKLGRPAKTSEGGEDIWYRRTHSEEFQIRVGFYDDTSVSKLHPTLRVRRVTFSPDKRKPWMMLMSEITEVHAICGGGCHVAAMFDIQPHIYACRSTPGLGKAFPDVDAPPRDAEPCVDVWFEPVDDAPATREQLDRLEVYNISIYPARASEAIYDVGNSKDELNNLGIMRF